MTNVNAGGLELHARLIGRLKVQRQHVSMSQAAAAGQMKRLGHDAWHQTTVAKVEADQRPVSFAEAIDLAHVLQVQTDIFLGLRDDRDYSIRQAYCCQRCDFVTTDRVAMIQHRQDHATIRSSS